jgi:hypothetical protein
VAAVAQFARREEVPDPEDVAAVVEKVHGVGVVEEFAPTEVAKVLGVSTRTADTRVEHASRMALRHPGVLGRVAYGEIELGQAHRVAWETEQIESLDEVHAVDAYVAARTGSSDPTRLAALTRYAISRTCPHALRARAVKNKADRSLDVRPGPAGLAEVHALVPAEQAAAIWEAADTLARDYQLDDPTLSLDQARADAFVDLALANVTVTATVTLGVPVVTSGTGDLGDNPHPCTDRPSTEAAPATGADQPSDEPAPADEDEPSPEPTGAGAGEARDRTSAADAEEWDERRDVDHDPWYARHTNTDRTGASAATACCPLPSGATISGVHLPKVGYIPPDVVAGMVSQLGTKIGLAMLDATTGTLRSSIREAYRPDAGMRHFITIRDGRCRMFGCQQRAEHWDLDHAIAHPDGATTPTNLSGLCRRHHRAKQHRSWRYHLLPDGTATWTSPTGTTRVTYPEHHLPRPPDPPPQPTPTPVPNITRPDDAPPF